MYHDLDMKLSRNRKWLLWLVSLFILLLLIMVISAGLGVARISASRIVRITFSRIPFVSINKDWSDRDELILMEWRLPRIFIACVVGAGLALAGVVFQALLRNPLADPYILGVSSGGSLGAVIAIMLGISAIKGLSTLPFFAFLGSLSTMFMVYSIARIGGRVPTHTLLLAGVVVNSFFSAIIMFIVSIVRANETHKFLLWSMGNLSPVETKLTITAMALIILGGIALYLYAQAFNLFSLGEESAMQLGVEVERVKKIAFVLASLITGAAVSACGIIGFVGLIIPHIIRMIVGADHRILMPTSALAGAAFLIAADTVARTITAPAEIPVGVVTAICGGPFFIYLLRRKRRSFSGV
jgi:iron complex transport system permease protein